MKKNQRGLTLLEMILVLALFAIIALGIIMLISRQVRSVKNQLTSAQMTQVIEASRSYVTDNFGKVQDDLNVLRAIGANTIIVEDDINNNGTIEESEKIPVVVAAIEIDASALTLAGYLPSNLVQGSAVKTPWGSELKIAAAFMGSDNVIQIIVLNSGGSNITSVDQMNIAAGVKGGLGSAWHGATSTTNACNTTTLSCIKSMYDQWEMKYPEKVLSTIFATELPTLNTSLTATAVYFLDGKNANQNALYKNDINGHKEFNTIKSDLNFTTDRDINEERDMFAIDSNTDGAEDVKGRGIFFNAMKHRDIDSDGSRDFSGSNLTYLQGFNNDLSKNDAVKGVLSVGNNSIGAQDEDKPYFSAQDGIVTGLEKESGDACEFDANNVFSDFGLLAVNATGNMMKCLSDNEWHEVGDIDYIHWINGHNGVTLNTSPLNNDATEYKITYDLTTEHPGLGFENASAILLTPENWDIEHRELTESIASFQVKDSVSDKFRNLIETIIDAAHHDISLPSGFTKTKIAIFPIKDGKFTYKYYNNMTSATIPVIKIRGYIE